MQSNRRNNRMKTIKEGFLRKNLGLGKDVLIRKWLDEHGVKNYTINNDLTIDVDGNVDLSFYEEEQLPDYIQFGNVKGVFYIRESDMISLRGCPVRVGKDFICDLCGKLTSLEGAPKEVDGGFYCRYCSNLTLLKGCPKEVQGNFSCRYCSNLTLLKGCPKEVGGDFDCSGCEKLESLKGAPEKVGGDFDCSRCEKLESLKGAPQKVGRHFYCNYCGEQFTKDDIKKVCKVNYGIHV